MHANDKAIGRSWYTADTAKLIEFNDCARWELHWQDGACVSCCEDSKSDAVEALTRYGFFAQVPA